MTKLGLVRRRRATRATFVQILNEPPSEMFNPPLGLYWPLLRSSSYPAPMTLESRTDFSSNQSRKLFFCPGCARDRLRVSPNPTSRVTTHGGPPPIHHPAPVRYRPIASPSPPPARVHRQRPRARRLLDAFASPRSRPRAHARAFAHTSHRSRDRRSRAVNPHHPNPRRRRPRRRHRARTWLARFFPCTRCVRAFAAFTTTLVALTANMRSIASSSSAGAHARWRGRRRAGTCVHSPTQTYVMRIGAVCVSRRDGAHVRSRDHLGWVNHLPWVVMVISNHLVVI